MLRVALRNKKEVSHSQMEYVLCDLRAAEELFLLQITLYFIFLILPETLPIKDSF